MSFLFILIPGIFRLIARYVDFRDLINLMQTSLQFRNYVGKSDVWRHLGIDIKDTLDTLSIFNKFIKLDLDLLTYKVRDYYSSWYYLYIMKKYLRYLSNNNPSVYNLYNNKFLALINISVSLLEPLCEEYFIKYSSHGLYNTYPGKCRYGFINLSDINHPNKKYNKILKMIYLSNDYHPHSIKYYILDYSLYYNVYVDYIYITHDELLGKYSGKDLRKKLKIIGDKLSIDWIIFKEILERLFGINYMYRERFARILYS